jgi:hypothetical protein
LGTDLQHKQPPRFLANVPKVCKELGNCKADGGVASGDET